jgi:hypothetical protein
MKLATPFVNVIPVVVPVSYSAAMNAAPMLADSKIEESSEGKGKANEEAIEAQKKSDAEHLRAVAGLQLTVLTSAAVWFFAPLA